MSAYLLHSLIHAVQIICLGDVRLDGSYVLPNSSNGLIQSLLPSGHYENVGAFVNKALCCRQSDHTNPSGTDRYFSVHSQSWVTYWLIHLNFPFLPLLDNERVVLSPLFLAPLTRPSPLAGPH